MMMCDPCTNGDHDDCERIVVNVEEAMSPPCDCVACKSKPHRCGCCGGNELWPAANTLDDFCLKCESWIDENGRTR